jgi:adenylate cyclase
MQLAREHVNEKLYQMELPKVSMGIGINTGEVVVGNIGSEKRTKYGIVGNQVNLTYRIESYTVGGQIFVSESTIKEVGEIVKIRREMEVHPKGASNKITVYEVAGIAGKYGLYLAEEAEIFSDLSAEIPLHYALVDGKDVSNAVMKGTLFRLSAKGGFIHYDPNITPVFLANLTNLKLNFFINDHQPGEDVYAKVLTKPVSKDSFYVRFTNIPPSMEIEFNKISAVNQR